MIRSLLFRSLCRALVDRRWDRDRRRRIAQMRRCERVKFIANVDWIEAMAIQLAEIRALPEPVETRQR
jgi:hypothetical protein